MKDSIAIGDSILKMADVYILYRIRANLVSNTYEVGSDLLLFTQNSSINFLSYKTVRFGFTKM